MALRDWLAEGRVERRPTSRQEIAGLLDVVERDLADARVAGVSADGRFERAYNAALQLATIVLRAAGYRTRGEGHHWLTFRALEEVMGRAAEDRARYLDTCRRRRAVGVYERAGTTSEAEVEDLIGQAEAFRGDVLVWLRAHHRELAPDTPEGD